MIRKQRLVKQEARRWCCDASTNTRNLTVRCTSLRRPYQISALLLGIAVFHPMLAHSRVFVRPGSPCNQAARLELSSQAFDCADRFHTGSAAFAVADAQEESLNMPSEDTEKRGQELKTALQQAYHQLRSSGKPLGLNTDVTSYVLPYLPPGISFKDAEQILADAGFAVGSRPNPSQANNPNRASDWYAVLARISPFVEDTPNKVSVYVTLLPKSPGDYSIVEKLTASFFVSGP
jgi:hypothetical protein